MAWSFVVQEDRPDRLLLEDRVVSVQSQSCGTRVLLIPEQSTNLAKGNQSAVPYRSYTVALPSLSSVPVVQIEDLQMEPFVGELASNENCTEQGASKLPTAGPTGVVTTRTVIRDGLPRATIYIPLAQGSFLRKAFRLRVSWTGQMGAGHGALLGKRALAQVVNPKSARLFAVPVQKRALRRVAGDLPSAIEWMAQIPIGDRDHASQKEDGMYALTFSQLQDALQGTSLENSLAGISVSKLVIAGGTGDTLPETPATKIPGLGPLEQQPILVFDHSGSGDLSPNGIWDEGDTLVFYGSGTSLWKRMDLEDPSLSVAGMEYYFSSNPYSFQRYVYFGVLPTGASGKRLPTLPKRTGGTNTTQLDRYIRAEKDLLLRDSYFGILSDGWEENTGREWFWIWASTMSDSLRVENGDLGLPQVSTLPNMVGSQAKVAVGFFPHRSIYKSLPDDPAATRLQAGDMAISADLNMDNRYSTICFRMDVNGDSAVSLGIRQPGGQFLGSLQGIQSSGNRFAMTIYPNGRQFDRFDGFSLAYPATITWRDTAESWLPGSLSGVRQFTVAKAPTNLWALKLAKETPVGLTQVSLGGFTDSISAATDVRYHLFKWGTWQTVSAIEPWVVSSQGVEEDISSLSGNKDYVMICPRSLLSTAHELQDFRAGEKVTSPVQTSLIDLPSITQQFGGGVTSPTAIRDFLRYARDQWSNLKYVLLVGNGHADYRRIRSTSPELMVPTFEKEEMGTDDYYAILDSGEAIFTTSYDYDLAVGRLPVSTPADLSAYISKAKEYEDLTQADLGNWRNTLVLSADDAYQADHYDGAGHAKEMENQANMVRAAALADSFEIDMHKIYLHAYPLDAAKQKPEAARDLIARMNQGNLFTYYFGHGSSVAWADEGLLGLSAIPELYNSGRYFVLGSFACTVGRFDIPSVPSLSQLFLNATERGAIASIGAMRESFPGSNATLAGKILLNGLGGASTLGEAFYRAKGEGMLEVDYGASLRYNSQKYVLLGEPALKLPQPVAKITLNQEVDTLQALQNVRLSGKVTGGESAGNIFLQVLEGQQNRDVIQQIPDRDPDILAVSYQGGLIYSEVVPYKDGRFSTQFVSPRKINFGDTAAQIRLWSWSQGSGKLGRGLVSGIQIHGTSSYKDSIHDIDPPSIAFRPCGLPDSLARSYSVGKVLRLESPACLDVLILDSTGLDMREDPDEGISFELVGQKDPWHPWPFLEQSGKRVLARMDFSAKYAPGLYRLKVRALDILGNVGTAELQIELTAGLKTALQSIYNAPNPMGKSGTTFYFRNLAENHRTQVSIEIFGSDGRVVQVIRDVQSGVTRWNGKDHRGRTLANGLYHYVLTCTVFPEDESGKIRRFRAKQKLVISR